MEAKLLFHDHAKEGSAMPRLLRDCRTLSLGVPILFAAFTCSLQTTLAASKEVTLSGSVVDTAGKPVAGAEVFFVAAESSGQMILFLNGKEASSPRQPAVEMPPVRSDAEGKFTLVLKESPDGTPPSLFYAALWVLAPNHQFERVAISADSASSPIRVVLAPAGDFRMTIVAPDGRPARGAQLTITGLFRSVQDGGRTKTASIDVPRKKAVRERLTITADGQGAVVCSAVNWQDVVKFEVTHPDVGQMDCRWR